MKFFKTLRLSNTVVLPIKAHFTGSNKTPFTVKSFHLSGNLLDSLSLYSAIFSYLCCINNNSCMCLNFVPTQFHIMVILFLFAAYTITFFPTYSQIHFAVSDPFLEMKVTHLNLLHFLTKFL